MTHSKKAAKSVLIIIIFSFISKILGFIREQLIAAKFGADGGTDAFIIALSAVGLFTSVISASINTTMIPVLSVVESREGKAGKKEHVNNLLNVVLFLSIIMMMIGLFLAPFIMRILASGFDERQFRLAVLLMRIGIPTIVLAGIVGVFRGYLQSEMMFTESALSNFPFNFTYISFLVFLSSLFGIKGLMVTSVLAVLSQIILQIPSIRKAGYKFNFIINFKDKYVKRILYLIPPVLISVGIDDINTIIDKSLASRLIEGSISALNYSNRLVGLTTGIFVSAIITVIYPMLSQKASNDNSHELKRVILMGINIIIIVTVPTTVAMIVLANPIVKLAFQRGKFDATATYMTAGALVFYSVGLIGTAFKSLLTRVYYSLQDTKTPMINSFIAVIVNVIFNFILIDYMQHKGLALATSISSISTALYLLYELKKKVGSFGFSKSIICALKSIASASIMGVVIYFLDKTIKLEAGILSELIELLISVGAGALVYFILIYLFKIEEVEWTIKTVKVKLKK